MEPAVERKLLSGKDDFDPSDKDETEYEEVLLSWNPARNYGHVVRLRDRLKDRAQELYRFQGQRLLVLALAVANAVFLIYILASRHREECYDSSPIGMLPFHLECICREPVLICGGRSRPRSQCL